MPKQAHALDGHGFTRALHSNHQPGVSPQGSMMESHQSKRILFLGEQDGDPEKDFKLAIQSCVANNEEIKAVYLLRISLFEAPGATVALCIYPEVTSRDPLLECISSSFRKIFMTGEQLDILFLAEHQKLEVDAVAKPFFER